MISLDQVLKGKLQEELQSILQSEDTEKKIILGLQFIFTTDFPDLGWKLLETTCTSEYVLPIDEKFVADLLNPSLRFKLPLPRVIKFITFALNRDSTGSLNAMAIQKHLISYAQKSNGNESELNLDALLQIIQIIEQNGTNNLITVVKLLIQSMSNIPLPREANELLLMKSDVIKIRDFFRNIQMSNEDRFQALEYVFQAIIDTKKEPMPLVALGFALIQDNMISQAVEYFFKTLQWTGKKTKDSIVTALGRLIHWLRSTNVPVPLELWIIKSLQVLKSNDYIEIIEEVARKNIVPAYLTLVVPVFQSRMFLVFQALLENSRNVAELFELIAQRTLNLLKRLEDTKCEIYEPLLDLICELVNSVDNKYPDINNFLEARNRIPSKIIGRKLIGQTFMGFLSGNARVGLENLGNTCYLNSILQALFMTKQFSREILTSERSDRTVISLQKLFALMLFSPRPEQNPREVVNIIRPDDFLPGIQHDSSEFLGSLLDRLHELDKKRIKEFDEDWDTQPNAQSLCNGASNDSGVSTSQDTQPMETDFEKENVESDSKEPKDKVVDNTANLCHTYIQKIFGGKISTRYLCSSCNSNSINVDSFRDLQLSFPEKNQDESTDVEYNVQQLLEFYFTTEELTLVGDNQYHCDNCKILCNGMRCTEILEAPRNLILTLKHFQYDSRYHKRSKLLYKVFHNEIINVNVKASLTTNSTRSVEYKLYAAVIHSGTSLDSGHYFTIARESDGKWFKFDDSFVTKSSLSELRSLISPNTPYILFYQRLSTASATVVHAESACTSNGFQAHLKATDSFPEYSELPTYLRILIDEDKGKYDTEMRLHQQNQMRQEPKMISSVRDWDDEPPSSSGSSFNDNNFSRFIC